MRCVTGPFSASHISTTVEIRFKDVPKKLPLVSHIFEWLEAKQHGFGKEIIVKENELNNQDAWKARLLSDNADTAVRFPGGMKMPRPNEWKSIQPDRWGDEAAVEKAYKRLAENYRKKKRKIDSVSRVDDTAAAVRGENGAATFVILYMFLESLH